MQVHLVAVEVGVVGTGVAQVHSEGRPGQDLDLVAHHTHLVERRLPVEDDEIAVADVTLHSVAALQMEIWKRNCQLQSCFNKNCDFFKFYYLVRLYRRYVDES